MNYGAFLDAKRIVALPAGFGVDRSALSLHLFEWQKDVVIWALRRGRAALFEDCGLGKTLQQIVWAHHVAHHTGRPVLIVAPLAVSGQTQREGEKFGFTVTVCRTQADVQPGVNVTNYAKLQHFDPDAFGGLVLDESSILKGNGPLYKQCAAFARPIAYRLACTATPAPNDHEEMLNHAEFLGIMRTNEALALYFTQDGNTTHKWRIKGHAREDYWRWVSSWAVAVRKPSDLGYPNEDFTLPPATFHQHTVEAPRPKDTLFATEALGIKDQRQVRRDTLEDRIARCAELVNGSDEPWIVWCDLNAESEALAAAIPDAVEVRGSDSDDHKERTMLGFTRGEIRVLVSKPSICGYGMNWQHCARMLFSGLGNSYEQYYQAIRRCHRFGQKRPVEVHIVASEADGPIARNIERKEGQAQEMMGELTSRIQDLTGATSADREDMTYAEDTARGERWTLHLGDCIERIRSVETESVGLSVFSPPFPSMYAYTNSPRDIGNALSFGEMIQHFRFMMPELLRVTQPGRTCAVHLTQALAFLSKDGYVGLKDFRGEVIRSMERAGWIYYGDITIDKNPQLKAIRTKDRGLLFKTLATDSSHMHMALADYMLQFRKPGDNAEPIRAGISEKYGNPDGWITQEEWIRWARPVWYAADFVPEGEEGIAETDVLNVVVARETDDERHLCPLQLGVIHRAVKLWSNPGDLILSPFAGIGSEGFEALRCGRRFVGIELKRSYWQVARRNLESAAYQAAQPNLLDLMAEETVLA